MLIDSLKIRQETPEDYLKITEVNREHVILVRTKELTLKLKCRNQKEQMTPEEEKELAEHIDAIGKILYKQAKPEQVKTQRVRADRRKTTGKALLSARE